MAISQYRLALENRQEIVEQLEWLSGFGNARVRTKY